MPETLLDHDPLRQTLHSLAAPFQEDCIVFGQLPTQSPAGRRLIAQGKELLPYILEELRTNPMWLLILPYITGINPVEKRHFGDASQMAEVWLEALAPTLV